MEKDNSQFYALWNELDNTINELTYLHRRMAGGRWPDPKGRLRRIAALRLRRLEIIKALKGTKAPVSKP